MVRGNLDNNRRQFSVDIVISPIVRGSGLIWRNISGQIPHQKVTCYAA